MVDTASGSLEKTAPSAGGSRRLTKCSRREGRHYRICRSENGSSAMNMTLFHVRSNNTVLTSAPPLAEGRPVRAHTVERVWLGAMRSRKLRRDERGPHRIRLPDLVHERKGLCLRPTLAQRSIQSEKG